MNIRHLRASQVTTLLTRPHQHGGLTRRQFLKAGATAAAVAVGSGLGQPRDAWADSDHKSPRDPRPIPYGTPFLFPDPTLFHVQAPGYPLPNPPFDTNPATNDPATITDFNGFVGLAYVGGQGTHHNLVTGQTASLYWEVDMRFMVGEYVGQDGRHHHATFGFV
jgi:hypothetical protein